MRILDIDLDFFLERVAHYRAAGGARLDPDEYPPWSVDDVIAFLEERCGLTGTLPGWAVEQHAEIFDCWREAIERGDLRPPLSVTHVDAHADLGLGESSYIYVLTKLLFKPIEKRTHPARGQGGLTDGSWLMFAIACQWVSDLTYVFNGRDGRPVDLMQPVMENFDTNAKNIQLAGITKEDMRGYTPSRVPRFTHLEPKVPFTWIEWRAFKDDDPYDFICLTRSPEFTPAEADPIYDAIRERFVAELPLPAQRREEERPQSRDW